jgi:hypothetical protein
MKRLGLIGFSLMVALFLFASAHAGPVVVPGSYSTDDGDFTTTFWKEKFFGGGPGQPGNVLMAVGQGFILQNVVLQSVEECAGEADQWCGLATGDPCYSNQWDYKTTYEGGFLRLNSKGPWLKKGKLKDATDLQATNYSYVDQDNNLHFCLTINDAFDRVQNVSYDIVATFDGTPDNYQMKYDEDGPVFQKGYYFNAVITISDDLSPSPK